MLYFNLCVCSNIAVLVIPFPLFLNQEVEVYK